MPLRIVVELDDFAAGLDRNRRSDAAMPTDDVTQIPAAASTHISITPPVTVTNAVATVPP